MIDDLIIVRGGGDIATGIIQKFHRTGFKVLVLEINNPSSIRRSVCLSEALYTDEIQVEDICAIYAKSLEELPKIFNMGKIPVIIDEKGECIEKLNPIAVIDAILAKKNFGTKIDMASCVVGVGPGFEAGKDVHIVIETMRGHNLGRLIFAGIAMENTGIPGAIAGIGKERVLYSPKAGTIDTIAKIGDTVEKGQVLATINGESLIATIDGVLRGLIRDKFQVFEGMKVGDIDPRISEKNNCYTISDKARAIGGGVLEAVIIMLNRHH